jgi:hypothetical protein
VKQCVANGTVRLDSLGRENQTQKIANRSDLYFI